MVEQDLAVSGKMFVFIVAGLSATSSSAASSLEAGSSLVLNVAVTFGNKKYSFYLAAYYCYI